MSSLQFLNKKSWHVGTKKNEEKVWLREQAAEKEAARIAELQKQLNEERKLEEVQRLEEEHGKSARPRKAQVNWMYEGPGAAMPGTADAVKAAVNAAAEAQEAALLGKTEAVLPTPGADGAAAGQPASAAKEMQDELALRDAEAKLREDPMLAIMRAKVAEAARRDAVSRLNAAVPSRRPPRPSGRHGEEDARGAERALRHGEKAARKQERARIREERRVRRMEKEGRHQEAVGGRRDDGDRGGSSRGVERREQRGEGGRGRDTEREGRVGRVDDAVRRRHSRSDDEDMDVDRKDRASDGRGQRVSGPRRDVVRHDRGRRYEDSVADRRSRWSDEEDKRGGGRKRTWRSSSRSDDDEAPRGGREASPDRFRKRSRVAAGLSSGSEEDGARRGGGERYGLLVNDGEKQYRKSQFELRNVPSQEPEGAARPPTGRPPRDGRARPMNEAERELRRSQMQSDADELDAQRAVMMKRQREEDRNSRERASGDSLGPAFIHDFARDAISRSERASSSKRR